MIFARLYRSSKSRRRPHVRLSGRWRRLEQLEDRAVPAVINWTGAAHDLNWLTAANWSGGVLPGPNDDALLPATPPGSPIKLAGIASVHSVKNGTSSLTITSGSLTIGTGQSNFGPGLYLNGGSLIPLDGASIVGGDIAGTNPLTIPAGVALAIQSTYVHGGFINQGDFDVTGQVQIDQLDSHVAMNSGTVTVAAGATLTIAGSFGVGTFTNGGTVVVAAGGTITNSTNQFFRPALYVQSAGVTTVDGTMTASPVLQGGVLAGTGTIPGFTQTAGTVSPGDPGGVLTINGNYSENGGALTIALNGPAASSQGELRVTNGVTLAGPLSIRVGYVPGPGDTFEIVDNGGVNPISGQFTGLPEGATLTADNQTFRISYAGGDGNDVTLTRLGSATDAIWDGAPDGGGTSADATWTTASNWVGDVAPAAGDDLYFPATAAQRVNVNTFPAGTAFDSITFTGSGYDISGNGIALSAGLRDTATAGDNRFDPDIALMASQVFSIATAGETLFLGGAISGDAAVSLNKEIAGATSLNAGTLRFDGNDANAFAGILTVNGGTLELDKTGAVAVSGPLVIGDGVGSDAVTETGGNQIADTAAVTVAANGALAAVFGDSVGTLTFDAGGSLNTGGSILTVAGLTTINGSAAADTLAITGTNPFTATLNGTALGPIAAQGGVTFDGAGGSDTLIGRDVDTTWAITGTNAGNLSGPIPLTFANVENLTGGSGNDSFTFAPTGGVAGMIDGGGGTNALDYSEFTTPIHTNLGIDIAASASLAQFTQYFTSLPFLDRGTASLTYHAATGTFDLSATIYQESSSHLQPFKLSGPNGAILDLLAVPGATYGLSGYPGYLTFTYSATGIALPPAYEAALFSDQIGVGGTAFGMLMRNTETASASGTATGAGGISNIVNVVGGSGDDGIIGSLADNVLRGGDGNDTILGGPGADLLKGGTGNDSFVWGDGDGSDAIDGEAGSDTVRVNGALGTVAESYTVQPGAGGRLSVQRTNLTPFALDIGTTESLAVFENATENVYGGVNDTFTVDNLASVSDLTTVNLVGNRGTDVFNVTPSPNVTVNVDGGAPQYPSIWVVNSGTLNVNAGGATDPAVQVALTYNYLGLPNPRPSLKGAYSFTNRQSVNFQNIGYVTPVVSDPSVVTTAAGDVTAGGQITYNIVVSNTGPSTITGVSEAGITVTDHFPAVLSGVTYTSVATSPNVSSPTGNTISGTGDINDTVNLPVGSTITYTITGTLGPAATGTLSNTATVTVPANDVDTNPANNSSTVTQTISSEADLSITNMAGAPAVYIGDNIAYTIAVNLVGGTVDAHQLTLTDILPDHTTFVSFAAPAGWTVSAPPVDGSGTVTATLETLAQGSAPQVFTLVLGVSPGAVATGSVTNTATIGSSIADGDLSNNSADAVTPVMPHPRPAVIGSGPGRAPLVNVFDQSTGVIRLSFDAYAPSFRGGVRVAMGDVTGDGVPDIITGAGPGGGPHVRVFDGVNGQQLAGPLGSFFAFDSSFTGGVFVASGDVNGDGRADLIVGAGAGGGPHVKVFSGADGSVLASFFAYGSNFRGGVTVATGDMTGDGKADIVTGAGAGGGPHVKVFSGADLSTVASFYAYAASFHGGVTVAAGDFNGDGKTDIVTGAGPGGGPQVKAFDGASLALGGSAADNAIANPLTSFYAYAPTFTGGATVAVTNLGGNLDLVTGPGPGRGPLVKIFDGLSAVELDSFYPFDPTFLGGVYVG